MSRFSSITSRTGTFLPQVFWPAHELCSRAHDVMTQLLVSGERAKAFTVKFDLSDPKEREAFESAPDVFDWLERHRPPEDRASVLVATMFPAILSDSLHLFYEALEASRKAKLGVSFVLLRKPLQESLYVLEAVLADRADFARKLTEDPLKLWSQGIGGREAHTRNIQKVLETIGETDRFDAAYLAQLRYDKSAADGFDGICNKAMHLFTGHEAIRTEPMDINFIFSNWDSKHTQWSFIYSRLPYLLVYMQSIVEHVCAPIAPTDPRYLDDMKRRLSALVVLWWQTVEEPYIAPHLQHFADKTREWLDQHCQAAGYRAPNTDDLIRMGEEGAYPGESRSSVKRRYNAFMSGAAAAGAIKATPWMRFKGWLAARRQA